MLHKIKISIIFMLVGSNFLYLPFELQAQENTKIIKKRVDKGRKTIILKVRDEKTGKQRRFIVYANGKASELIGHRDSYNETYDPVFTQNLIGRNAIESYLGDVTNDFGSSLIVERYNQ